MDEDLALEPNPLSDNSIDMCFLFCYINIIWWFSNHFYIIKTLQLFYRANKLTMILLPFWNSFLFFLCFLMMLFSCTIHLYSIFIIFSLFSPRNFIELPGTCLLLAIHLFSLFYLSAQTKLMPGCQSLLFWVEL